VWVELVDEVVVEISAVKEGNQDQGGMTAVSALRDLLRFPFQDAGWRNKFLVGSGLILLNIVIPFLPMLALGGYCLKVMRQGVRGEAASLPEWSDWGDLIMEGLKGAALVVAYLAPGYVVMFGGLFLTAFGQALIIPLMAAIGSSSGDPEAIASSLLATLTITFGTVALQFGLMAVSMLVLLVGLLPLPLALGHYLHEGELGAGLRLREIWGLLKVNKSGYLAVWVIYVGLAYTLSLPVIFLYFTLILICLMPFILGPITFYTYLIGSASFGQHYRDSRRMWQEKAAK
jgi:hypothetical protein